jgi:general secretion pathway protein D
LLIAIVASLAACTAGSDSSSLLERRLDGSTQPSGISSLKPRNAQKYLTDDSGQNVPFNGFSQPGTDRLVGAPIVQLSSHSDNEAEDVMLNLVGATIPQAAKSVLNDILELDYSVDARVVGSITLQTPKPISRRQLLTLFEANLRDNAAAIVRNGNGYRIVPLADASRSTAALRSSPGSPDSVGTRPELVVLRYVSAQNIREVLEPMIPQGMLVKVDDQRNALILSGTAREIASIRETISVFDVDWMKGMSFALIPVKSSSPASIVRDLDQIFQSKSGPLKGLVKFVPNDRLRSVLVISSRSKYLAEASRWIKKIDVLAQSGEDSLHVYHVQNRNASELAKILDSVVGSGNAPTQSAQNTIAPKLDAVVGVAAVIGGAAEVTKGPETPAGGIDSSPTETIADSGMDQPHASRMKIVADDANNALLVYCSDTQFERIKRVLSEVDSVPNQVLLEAVIAEVSLTDDMKFGVRWFLGQSGGSGGGGFSDAENGATVPVFPGFSYFLKSNDISFSLNALTSVTNVRVLSAPSLMVLDNKTATLQVGDQVPIVTQSSQAVTAAGAPVVTNVQLKDTGLILKVTPRVNDSGLVTLDITQEVSSVVKTTTSGIDSPTIQQRKMTTSVVIQDSEALALGGLIQEKENTGVSKIPVLGDIPILRTAFRHKANAISRTELVIFIRPRVIRDLNEARRVTEEFRRELSVEAPRVRKGEPIPGEELVRIFN